MSYCFFPDNKFFCSELNSTTEIRTVNLKTFTRRKEGRILGKQVPASSFQDSERSLKPRKSDVSTYSHTSSGVGGYSETASVCGGYDKEILTLDVKTGKRYEPTGSLKDTPFVLLHTIKEVKEIDFCLKKFLNYTSPHVY